MTRDEMIEKAARAMYEGDWEREASLGTQAGYRFMADAALSAVCPGLLAGTHWEAPMEATEGMAFYGGGVDYRHGKEDCALCWQSMRDAYLAEQGGGG